MTHLHTIFGTHLSKHFHTGHINGNINNDYFYTHIYILYTVINEYMSQSAPFPPTLSPERVVSLLFLCSFFAQEADHDGQKSELNNRYHKVGAGWQRQESHQEGFTGAKRRCYILNALLLLSSHFTSSPSLCTSTCLLMRLLCWQQKTIKYKTKNTKQQREGGKE